MVAEFSLALRDTLAPRQRRTLLLSLALALALVAALWIAATLLIASVHIAAVPWIDAAFHLLGSLGAMIVAWMLFPAMSMLLLGLFLDGVVAAIESEHYPDLPPARRIGTGEAVASALRIAVLALVLNLVALPLYLFPGVNLAVYYGLNGYLVGREYFELIALRRVALREARALWRWSRGTLLLAGAAIAFLLSLPLVGLAAPLIGAAFMLHLFERLRRRGTGAF